MKIKKSFGLESKHHLKSRHHSTIHQLFRFMHLLLYIFTHFAGHHPTRLLPTAAHTPASTPLFACQKLVPRLPALENAEEINFLFCLWSRGPAAPLNPPARGHNPGSPFLPPTCHVNMPLLSCQKKMTPHHSVICLLQDSNQRPQLTKCVLLPDMAHISGTHRIKVWNRFIRLLGVHTPCVLEISSSAALAGPLFN